MTVLIIVAVIIIIAEIAALVFLSRRRRKARKSEAATETANETAEPAPDLSSATAEMELTIPPEVSESSTLPEEAKSLLMNAVWYRCENHKCNFTRFLDVYHIVPEEKEGSNTLDNLVVLCPTCRTAAKNGETDVDELRSWVKGRVERFKFALDWPYK